MTFREFALRSTSGASVELLRTRREYIHVGLASAVQALDSPPQLHRIPTLKQCHRQKAHSLAPKQMRDEPFGHLGIVAARTAASKPPWMGSRRSQNAQRDWLTSAIVLMRISSQPQMDWPKSLQIIDLYIATDRCKINTALSIFGFEI